MVSENNHSLTCKHAEFDYFLKPAVNIYSVFDYR